jgi:hypothetical protein
LEAADAELEALLAPLRPVERRRLLRVIGRPIALSRVAAAQTEDPPLQAFCVQRAAADEAFSTSQRWKVCSLAEAAPLSTSLIGFAAVLILCLPFACRIFRQ